MKERDQDKTADKRLSDGNPSQIGWGHNMIHIPTNDACKEMCCQGQNKHGYGKSDPLLTARTKRSQQ